MAAAVSVSVLLLLAASRNSAIWEVIGGGIGTDYVSVAAHVGRFLTRLPDAVLVLDLTGVGLPIRYIFVAVGVVPVGIVITGGGSVKFFGSNIIHVPKLHLIFQLQSLLIRPANWPTHAYHADLGNAVCVRVSSPPLPRQPPTRLDPGFGADGGSGFGVGSGFSMIAHTGCREGDKGHRSAANSRRASSLRIRVSASEAG